MHNFTREFQSHWHRNFLPDIRYVAAIPCESVRHKSNTFHTILALCTCLYRSHLRKPVSMKQKIAQQKIRGSKFIFKMSTNHANTYAFKRLPVCHCAIAAAMTVCMVQQSPLPQQTFFQLLHIMDPRTVDPLLKHIPDAVVHRIQVWRIRWPHLWRDI